MQEKTILAKTPTPGQWIRKRLHDLGRSQKTLARDIGYDASQVNRWISGKEQVPDKALMLAGACLDGPGDVHNAISLMEIHKFAEGLPHDAQKHIGTNEEAGREVARVLAARAEETAAQLSSDENDRLIHLRDHLLTACEVLVMTNQCNEHGMDLIREENIQKHLRFPFNVMTGDVLKMMGRGRGGDPDVPEHFGRYESAGGRGHWGLTLSRRAIKFREVVRRVRPR